MPDPLPRSLRDLLAGREPDQLLEDTRWLRGLARALVGDAALAEDLVQDAFGIAAARHEPVQDLRGYLAGIVRRLAARGRRGARRRRRRELVAAREERLPGVDEIAERIDAVRVVLEELRQLAPARQRILGLRYLEHLAPAEIAEREGCTPSTVRAQLSRGLAELRQRLDRRAGGREGWYEGLLPWLAPLTTAHLPDDPAPHGASGSVSAGGTRILTTTRGALLMSTLARTALVLSSCVACLALWQLRDLAPEPRSGAVRDGLAAVEPGVRSDGDPERVHAPLERDLVRDPAVQGTPLEDPAAGPPIPIRAHLVDALTGESVPDLGLVLSDGQRTLEVRSDAEGRVLHGESLAQGTIELRERDHDGPGAATTAPRRVSFPLPERLPVHVGPTFRLRLDLPDGVSIDELTAHFHEPVQRRQVGRPTSVRRGDLPWVRFPFEVTTLAGNGPFVLEVTHRSGLWRATAEVSRKQGVERVPVVLDLQPTGVAQFRVEQPEGTPKTIFLLDVESESGGVRRRLYPSDADSGPGFAGGRLSHLEPGAYRWILGGAGGRSGTFHVEAGRTTRVEISPDATGLTFDTAVRIDASADPGLDPKAVMAFVVHAERMDSGFQARARHEEGDPAGIWWVRLQEVPAGRWLVAFTSPSEAAVWDPPFVLVSPSIVPPTVTLVSLGEMVPVRLTVVDASGLPIPGAEATSTSDGLTETWFTPDGTGGLLPGNLPSQRTSTLHVRAPGHRCRAVEHHPERDGRELAVRLEPGWSNRVRVLDAATLRGAEGVRVLADGVPVGETDGRGEVWLTGQAPPAELQVTGEGVEVVTAPADRSDEGADPLAGWIFVVSLR